MDIKHVADVFRRKEEDPFINKMYWEFHVRDMIWNRDEAIFDRDSLSIPETAAVLLIVQNALKEEDELKRSMLLNGLSETFEEKDINLLKELDDAYSKIIP